MTAAEPAVPAVGGDARKPGRGLVYRHEPTLFALGIVISVLAWLAIVVGSVGIALLYGPIFYLGYLFAHSALISHLKGSAVRITPQQFPDLHQRLQACCAQLQMKDVPEAYLLHGNGIFNAFATRFRGRYFIVLFSDVVDALADQPEALNFYIGHELGHIRRRHLAFQPLLAPAGMMPLLGAAYSRAREYTCDLHGLACCANADAAARGLAALAAGHERWRTLDLSEFGGQARESGGFWMSFHELVGDYPWLAKRVAHVRTETPEFPSRSVAAWILALFVPRTGMGGAGPLVLVAMVGIMAAVAIPAYQDYTTREKLMTVVSQGDQIGKKVEGYAMSYHRVPESPEAAGIAPFPAVAGVSGVLIRADGSVEVTLDYAPVQGKHIYFVPSRNARHEVVWKCQSDIEARRLPPNCR